MATEPMCDYREPGSVCVEPAGHLGRHTLVMDESNKPDPTRYADHAGGKNAAGPGWDWQRSRR
jgi:hypothetical protein